VTELAWRRQASANRDAYNRVFTHTPRNDFGTLLEGRKHYPHQTRQKKEYSVNGVPIGEVSPDGRLRDPYILVDEPIEKRDFSKVPPLQPAFMNGAAHNVNAAIKELRATVKGFFVEMPLEWGIKIGQTPRPPRKDPAMIAENDTQRNLEEAG
jgi:phospholipase D1/2